MINDAHVVFAGAALDAHRQSRLSRLDVNAERLLALGAPVAGILFTASRSDLVSDGCSRCGLIAHRIKLSLEG